MRVHNPYPAPVASSSLNPCVPLRSCLYVEFVNFPMVSKCCRTGSTIIARSEGTQRRVSPGWFNFPQVPLLLVTITSAGAFPFSRSLLTYWRFFLS